MIINADILPYNLTPNRFPSSLRLRVMIMHFFSTNRIDKFIFMILRRLI